MGTTKNHGATARRAPGELAGEAARTFGRYLRGQLIVAGIMAAFYAVGFEWAEVPLWLLAAVICGVFHLIPVVGSLLAILIPIGLTLAAGGGLAAVLKIAGIFVVAQILETFYLTPKILGREMRVSPIMVFVAMLLGGMTFGLPGALLAPPLAAIGYLVWRRTRPES